MRKIYLLVIILLLFFILFVVFKKSGGNKSLDVGDTSKKEVTTQNMNLTSSAFENGGVIPEKYTCDGENVNPPLEIANIPDNTQSLVLIVDDPDSPSGDFTHWVLFNIPKGTTLIEDGTIPTNSDQAKNDFGKSQYLGPCPPSGTHRYVFTLYCLDTMLSSDLSTRGQVEKEIEGHVISQAQITAKYSR